MLRCIEAFYWIWYYFYNNQWCCIRIINLNKVNVHLLTHNIISILCYKYFCNNTPIILKLQYGNSGCSMIKVASNWVYMTCDEVYSYHLQHFNLLFQLLFAIDSVIAQRFFCVQARFHNISCQFYCSQFDMLIRPYMVCFFSQ